MKLSVDLDNLWASVKRMGAQSVEVDLDIGWNDSDIEFDDELSRGMQISIEDLEETEGLLSVRGRQVVLFIPDHSRWIERALNTPGGGNKFHIADCEKLDEMRSRKRFDRYNVTTDLSGIFHVFGVATTGEPVEADVHLNACKFCLNKLNYKGAKTMNAGAKNELASNLDLAEFFSTYSSLFKSLPKQITDRAKGGYTADWKTVSQRVRKEANYTCGECRVQLDGDKGLLHVHHLNGVKSDNSPDNLLPLCADCHRKQPYHEHMHVTHQDTVRINQLRREQGLIDLDSWNSVIKNADPAFFGVLDLARHRGMQPPEIGFELTNDMDEVIAEFEAAWPERRLAIAIGEPPTIANWQVLSLQKAMEYFGGRR